MSCPVPRRTPDPGRRLYRYELRVRTRMGQALTASFALLAGGSVVPGHAVRRLAVIRDDDDAVDLAAVVQRLTECGVAVLDARLCRQATPTAGPTP